MKHIKKINEGWFKSMLNGGKNSRIREKINTREIDSICRKYRIQNYTINPDESIDVDGDVNLSSRGLKRIPLKFRNVRGYFYCNYNQLTSLEGCPQSVGGAFSCSGNQLTSLEGCPQSVGGDFLCYENQLTSLEGCPQNVGGGGGFYCNYNQLTSLEGCPQSVGGSFYCNNNKLTSLEGCPQIVGGAFSCYNNKLTDFNGFPEYWTGIVSFTRNPVQKILNRFKNGLWCRVIHLLNEMDVIRGTDIIEQRFEEVYYRMKLEIPKSLEVEGYNLI